jgi:short-subunit dehydrogenase
MKVKNKQIVVTGAGGGIGGALVVALLKKGAKVIAVDLRQDNLQQLKQKASKFGDSLSIFTLDITDKASVQHFPETLITLCGDIDGLINCAGVVQPFVKINDLEYKEIDKVMDINFFGLLYITKSFLPYLLKRPEAHIVNISSMGGFLPVPGQSIYGASKAAVKLMSEGLYAELRDTNINVSVVFPGATDTNITENSHVKAPRISEEDIKKMRKSMNSAEAAAETIIKGMENNKLQIFTGKDSNLMNALYRLSPVFATNLITKQMKSLLE